VKRRLFILLLSTLIVTIPSFVYAAKTHKVKKNETLYSLADKYHVSINDLKSANNRLHSNIKPGDVLVIPPRSVERKSGGDASSSAVSTYKVRKGDTLKTVSRKTGVSIARLKSLNSLGKSKLRAGQVLALRETDSESGEGRQETSRKPSLRYADLLNEKEYEQSLAELMEHDQLQQSGISSDVDFKSDNVKILKSKAYGFLGTRYRFGGSTRNGLDCSAFVQKVFGEMDLNLPRTAREQFARGDIVTPGDMQKGDLVFFRTYASFPSHVGIYLGDNRMIHASSRDRRVVISSVDTPYYRSRFIGAKRIAKMNPDRFNLDELMIGIEEEIPDDAQKNDNLGVASIGELK
jgi:peptidoglycan endopeptidase LytE